MAKQSLGECAFSRALDRLRCNKRRPGLLCTPLLLFPRITTPKQNATPEHRVTYQLTLVLCAPRARRIVRSAQRNDRCAHTVRESSGAAKVTPGRVTRFNRSFRACFVKPPPLRVTAPKLRLPMMADCASDKCSHRRGRPERLHRRLPRHHQLSCSTREFNSLIKKTN